jgi:hypothetical protein
VASARLRSCALACAALIAAVSPVTAYPIQGIGSNSCAQFAADYRKNPEIWEISYFTWAQGYMSGLNISAMGAGNRPRDLAGDYSAQKQKIRSFCDQSPLKSYMSAIIDLWKNLPLTSEDK